MKKMFKKSIAMLIAVLMVISAMPFTAITASAAEGVFTNNGFTLVYNSGQDRWENNSQFNIVNDQQAGNTSVGIIRYDISSIFCALLYRAGYDINILCIVSENL